MILALSLIATAHASGAEARVTWKKSSATLEILAPGEHVAPEAPLSGWIALDGVRVDLSGTGAALARGWPLLLGDRDRHELAGQLSLSLCQDGGSTCRFAELAFDGSFSGRRGSEALPQVAPAAPEEQVLRHSGDAEAAFARAAESGKRVLLDFSAVWCPPCQVLMAEILHDPEEAALLDAFEVVELDADDPASFALKSRYEVGGYPTVVVADADGTLVDRMVGYPGEEDARAWLEASAGEVLSIAEILADPEIVPPEGALAAAERLLGEDEKVAAAAMAARAPDGLEKQLLLFAIAPDAEALSALIAGAPERLDDWLWDAYGLLAGDEEGALAEQRAQVAAMVAAAIPGADVMTASDYAYVAAELSEGEAASALYGSAAALLRAGMSGDARLDRGYYTFLAYLRGAAGDSEGALASLDEAIAAYPEEFTYHHARAGVLKEAGRYEEALAAERAAAEHAYGDMSLRAAMSEAAILEELDRVAEAQAVLRAALDGAERPEEGVEVRTTYYLQRIEEQLGELDGGAAAE